MLKLIKSMENICLYYDMVIFIEISKSNKK